MNDNTSDSGEPQWLPVVSVVPITGVPERTLYRWIQSRRLPSRTEDGVVKVELGAVRAIAAERPRANGRSGAGVPATRGRGASGRQATIADGDLAGRVFDLLDQGVAPTEIVRRERAPPNIILDLFRAYRALTEAGTNGKPSAESRIEALSAAFEELGRNASEFFSDIDGRQTRLEAAAKSVARYLAELPLPPRSAFECRNCHAKGLLRVPVICGGCGQQDTWGFQP